MAATSTKIALNNYSSAVLKLKDSKLDNGSWNTNPPERVGEGKGNYQKPTSSQFDCQLEASADASEGTVSYTLQDGETILKVYWKTPKTGDTVFTPSLDGPIAYAYVASLKVAEDKASAEVRLYNANL